MLSVDPGIGGERHEPRICALLWSSDKADPRLLATEQFRSVGEFRAWLVILRARWLGSDIGVQWTPRLLANAALTSAVVEVLIAQRPPEVDGAPRRAPHLPISGADDE